MCLPFRRITFTLLLVAKKKKKIGNLLSSLKHSHELRSLQSGNTTNRTNSPLCTAPVHVSKFQCSLSHCSHISVYSLSSYSWPLSTECAVGDLVYSTD
jgi:hypothetical protein